MELVYDDRASLQGGPGVHALIAGVSEYRHLPGGTGENMPDSYGMEQLSAAALSAYSVYKWLITRKDFLPERLATIRLLLSPSPAEVTRIPAMTAVTPCTKQAFTEMAYEWRIDAASNSNNITFFYFAGHGVQPFTSNSTAMLMEDFGAPYQSLLSSSVEVGNLFYGMAPSTMHPDIARTQFFFIDCCRVSDEGLQRFQKLSAPPLWDVDTSPGRIDDRRAPIFFAAVPGAAAYALPGQYTFFSKALLDCLNNDAADLRSDLHPSGDECWCIGTHRLGENLEIALEQWKRIPGGQSQSVRIEGSSAGKPILIHVLDSAPEVDVELEIAPQGALDFTELEVLDDNGSPSYVVPKPLYPNPYSCRWKAGFYTINAVVNPTHPLFREKRGRVRPVKPPKFEWKVEME